MSKVKLVIEIEESDYKAIKNDGVQSHIALADEIIANGTPINEGDMISREGIRKALNEAFDCEDATKYGNKNAEQQSKSYSTLMLYEIANIVEDCCDNAPTVEPICPYLSDDEVKQPCINSPCARVQTKWVKIFENPFVNGYVCPFCGHKIQVTEQFLPEVTECESCGANMRGDKNGKS